jgi:outer membrane usher protein
MYKGTPRPNLTKLRGRSAADFIVALAGMTGPLACAADPLGSKVEFDPAFLQGGSKVDVSRFSRGNPVLPGDYVVDLQVNGKWVGRVSIRFVAQPGSDVAQPCTDRALVARFGLDFEKLSPSALAELRKIQSEGCVDLNALVPQSTMSFDLSRLELDVTVPQAALLHKPRGYVGPEFWDSGVPSATLGYNLNAYHSTAASGVGKSVGHLDLAAGVNFGSWHLRQRSSVDVGSGAPSSYQNIATYLAHDVPSIRSDLTVGDSYTDGAVFDSFGFRGVSLASDDQMLPDSQLEYAPVVHGIARTNARVVITQNGNTILETTVSPGAFEINDLYATGYGGDLHVAVYEADGSQESFVVPYASVVQLLRPGVWRYAAVAGEVQQASFTLTERFVQATLQHGFNNYLTGYTGAVGAQHYGAGLLGIALNTTVGALAADVTEARTAVTNSFCASGQSLRISYSKVIHETQTNIAISSYRYSSSGYYSFAQAQAARQAAGAGVSPDSAEHARSQWQININQTLSRRWGNFYLSASVLSYWDTAGTSTQYQAGYANHFRLGDTNLNYSISIARQNNVLTGKPDSRFQANFSMPLGHSAHSPMFAASFNQDTSGGVRTRGSQELLNGAWGANSELTYSLSASQAAGDHDFAASGQYRVADASVSASLSEGSGYSQQALGATGGMVVHPGGITLANQMTDTIGVVEAIGAEGARVTNSIGTVINHSGYAVLPFMTPYRLNSINIDPDDSVSPDVEFKSTSESVAPRLNSVVMIRFQTVGGRAILFTAHLPDGSVVPFGASVYDEKGGEVGLAGQDGGIYVRGIAEAGRLTASWGDGADQKCYLRYKLPPKQRGYSPFVRIDAACEPGSPALNTQNGGGRTNLNSVIGQRQP